MISDPNLIRYACAAHLPGGVGAAATPTILAEYNSSAESSLHDLAHECLIRTPLHHSIFSHTIQNLAYTFLIDDPFVFFAVSAENLPKPDRIMFLNRLKDAAQHLISKHSKSKSKSSKRSEAFAPLCFQSQIQSVFHQLVSANNGVEVETVAVKAQSKRVFAVPLLAKVGEGLKKKKRLIGDGGSESKEVLVEDKVELSDQGEATSREAASESAVCLGDSAVVGAKMKARRIWRRHVWIVLVLDLAVCLVLLGVWLMVCHGLQCID